MLMSVAERKSVTEIWYQICSKYSITLMVQIGGATYTDVIELAKHANSLGVDAILCLPELYFRPKSEEKLVEYFVGISNYCKNTPLLYYHIPMFSGVNCKYPDKLFDINESDTFLK